MKTLRHFLLRSQVLQLYKKALRTAVGILYILCKDDDLKVWIRLEFRSLKTDDLDLIETRLAQGRVQLRNLEKSLLLARA